RGLSKPDSSERIMRDICAGNTPMERWISPTVRVPEALAMVSTVRYWDSESSALPCCREATRWRQPMTVRENIYCAIGSRELGFGVLRCMKGLHRKCVPIEIVYARKRICERAAGLWGGEHWAFGRQNHDQGALGGVIFLSSCATKVWPVRASWRWALKVMVV